MKVKEQRYRLLYFNRRPLIACLAQMAQFMRSPFLRYLGRCRSVGILISLLASALPVYANNETALVEMPSEQVIEVVDIAHQLANYFEFELNQRIFDGVIFGEPVSQWRIEGNDVNTLRARLAQQEWLVAYLGIGHVMVLDGVYANRLVLLWIEREPSSSYQGLLTIFKQPGQATMLRSIEAWRPELIQEFNERIKRIPLWVPKQAILLLDIEGAEGHQQIYFSEAYSAQQLQRDVSDALVSHGWQARPKVWSHFDHWQRDGVEMQLLYRQLDEGASIYILSQQRED